MMQIPGKPSIRQELTGEKPLPAPRQVSNEPLVEPKATDFTEVVASCTQDGDYAVRVLLASGPHIVVTPWVSKEEAERLELAINQGMIDYRTKRNAYEYLLDKPQHVQDYIAKFQDEKESTIPK